MSGVLPDVLKRSAVVRAPDAPRVDDRADKEIRLGGAALFAFFGIFLGWAAFAPLDAAIEGSGVVSVAGDRQTVQHREGGVVSALDVQEGQHVTQGQILVELSAPELIAQDRALFSQLVDLQMQDARLLAEANGTHTLRRPAEWSQFTGEDKEAADAAYQRYSGGAQGAWSEYDARISGYNDEIRSIDSQKVLLQQELDGMRSLAADNLVPLTRVRALERSLAELDGRRGELRAQIAATQQDRSQELRRVEARILEVAPQLANARAQLERTRLRAPTEGTVVGLALHTVGGVVRPGERVMDIVPAGQELIVEAQVRPEDADDVDPGQHAEVRITAFTGRIVPILHGTVRVISADRMVDEHTGRGYFVVRVAVPPEQLNGLVDPNGKRLRLRPGLPAQVIIPTRKRTALQYLLEPLNQALWRSFREN
ncbi:MAG TPA: HlyD family efflux transporter periplasmic adaptor subunit [Caulobacterales bacterium]|nr:HlyD family efflux transporter periplasmic adaptor subunit [Caulobacterales bacterium]